MIWFNILLRLVLRFTFSLDVVHWPYLCGPLSFIKKELLHKNKIEKSTRTMQLACPSILKQCGRTCDVVHPVMQKIVTKAKKVMRFTS